MKKNTTKKTRKTAMKPDHVDVTLPNGKEVRLYGDAVKMAASPAAVKRTTKNQTPEAKYRLDEQNLEVLAHYFGRVFEYNDEKAAVLIDFTNRLGKYVREGSRDGSFKPHLFENIIDGFALEMFRRTIANDEAAFRFKDNVRPKAVSALAPFAGGVK